VTKIRRGGYVFVAWAGDHSPAHVHVYLGGRLVVRWDLEKWKPIIGVPGSHLVRLLEELRAEGLL
jgi:hypothetical protein